MNKVAVLGAGSWGTALALQLARNNHQVSLWGHDADHVQALLEAGENTHYLPGFALPDNVTPTVELSDALAAADFVLAVVPSHAFAELLQRIKPLLGEAPFMWAIKGFEHGTGALLSDVFGDIIGANHPHALLAGPSFAKEVAANRPTAVTIAAADNRLAQRFATYFHGSTFLCYTSHDIIGAQIGGAVKNVIAITTGIADGLNCGANTRAALITRGLKEMTRLATALGADSETLNGLSGLGDLVLTATDDQSRNRRFGLLLGQGHSAQAAKEIIGQVVEGEGATFDTWTLAQHHHVRMPITEHLQQILSGETTLAQALDSLLNRHIKDEQH